MLISIGLRIRKREEGEEKKYRSVKQLRLDRYHFKQGVGKKASG